MRNNMLMIVATIPTDVAFANNHGANWNFGSVLDTTWKDAT
jgi:hypothetical protein